MDRKQVDREVRAALRDPKRHWLEVGYCYPETEMKLSVDIVTWSSDLWPIGRARVVCAPGDEYSEQVGYELVLDRCIHDIVDQIMAQEPPKPAQPRRKRAIVVIDGRDNELSVWCDDDVADKIKKEPFVQHLFRDDRAKRHVYLDIRYDKAECIAAIEALGRESQ